MYLREGWQRSQNHPESAVLWNKHNRELQTNKRRLFLAFVTPIPWLELSRARNVPIGVMTELI